MAQPKAKDLYVALMGLTGAGKSTFINHCTKQEVKVGDGLQACTESVHVYSFDYSPGITIHLVDTPGFDDTNRQDSEVLRDISAWLSKSYTEKVRLNGILYLHRISDPKMQGSGKMSINLLMRLCGRDALKSVVLTTTMWELVDTDVGDRREKELESTEEFWGFMKRHGSQTRRHYNNKESALKILSTFVPETLNGPSETVTLAIQKELADDRKTLDQTGAGQLLDGTWAKEKQALQRELQEVRDSVRMATEERDNAMAKLLQGQQLEMNLSLERMRKEQEKLRVNMEELHAERLSKLQNTLDQQMEVSRTLSKDLENRERLREMELKNNEELKQRNKEHIRERQAVIVDLQDRLGSMAVTSNPQPTPELAASLANDEGGQGSFEVGVPPGVDFVEITCLPDLVPSPIFSSDGRRLFARTGNDQVWIYDRDSDDNWQHIQTLACTVEIPNSLSSKIRALVLSSNDQALIAFCGNNLIRYEFSPLYGFIETDRRHATVDSLNEAYVMALSRDNRYLVCSGNLRSSNVQFWAPNYDNSSSPMAYLGSSSVEVMTGKNKIVTCLQFGPQGHLAVGLTDGEVDGGEVVICHPLSNKRPLTLSSITRRPYTGCGCVVFSISWMPDSRVFVGTDVGFWIERAPGTLTHIKLVELQGDPDLCFVHLHNSRCFLYFAEDGRGCVCTLDGDCWLPRAQYDISRIGGADSCFISHQPQIAMGLTGRILIFKFPHSCRSVLLGPDLGAV